MPDVVAQFKREHETLTRNLKLAQQALRKLARIAPPVCAQLARDALHEMKGKR